MPFIEHSKEIQKITDLLMTIDFTQPELKHINNVVRAAWNKKLNTILRKNLSLLSDGDEVFIQGIRPAGLNGTRGTITSIRGDHANLVISQRGFGCHRIRNLYRYIHADNTMNRVPITCLQKITKGRDSN